MFEALIDSIVDDRLQRHKDAIEVMTPPPMHEIFVKENRQVAMARFRKQQALQTKEVPSTADPGKVILKDTFPVFVFIHPRKPNVKSLNVA